MKIWAVHSIRSVDPSVGRGIRSGTNFGGNFEFCIHFVTPVYLQSMKPFLFAERLQYIACVVVAVLLPGHTECAALRISLVAGG